MDVTLLRSGNLARGPKGHWYFVTKDVAKNRESARRRLKEELLAVFRAQVPPS